MIRSKQGTGNNSANRSARRHGVEHDTGHCPIQHSVCRSTPTRSTKQRGVGASANSSHKAAPSDDLDSAWTETALSRYFGCPIRLYDPTERDWDPADSRPLGTLADADQDTNFWYPPQGTPIFCADADMRPCEREEGCFWTFAGSPTWFRSDIYPPPPR